MLHHIKTSQRNLLFYIKTPIKEGVRKRKKKVTEYLKVAHPNSQEC